MNFIKDVQEKKHFTKKNHKGWIDKIDSTVKMNQNKIQ